MVRDLSQVGDVRLLGGIFSLFWHESADPRRDIEACHIDCQMSGVAEGATLDRRLEVTESGSQKMPLEKLREIIFLLSSPIKFR